VASYDEQITRLDRDGCYRPSPAYFKERQLTNVSPWLNVASVM